MSSPSKPLSRLKIHGVGREWKSKGLAPSRIFRLWPSRKFVCHVSSCIAYNHHSTAFFRRSFDDFSTSPLCLYEMNHLNSFSSTLLTTFECANYIVGLLKLLTWEASIKFLTKKSQQQRTSTQSRKEKDYLAEEHGSEPS